MFVDVSLVEMLQYIYIFFTLKSQGQILTSGQHHVVTQKRHAAYHLMHLNYTHNEPIPSALSPFYYKLLVKEQLVTSNDLGWPFQRLSAKKSTSVITGGSNYTEIKKYRRLLCTHSNQEMFLFPPLTCNGEFKVMTWPWIMGIISPRYATWMYLCPHGIIHVSWLLDNFCRLGMTRNIFWRWGKFKWLGDLTSYDLKLKL